MKKSIGSKILAGVTSGAMAISTIFTGFVPVYAEQTVSSGGTVYISISDDDAYVVSDTAEHNGEVMAYIPVSIDAVAQEIDLEDYDLQDFQCDADGDDQYETTLLQAYLYVLEHYYSGGTEDLNITGSAGSMYMQNGFWGHDENLTYYVNGAYPLKPDVEAIGSTADEIVLEDGDFIDVSMYSDWDFYFDAEAGYHYFTDADGCITHEYQATAGQALEIGYARTSTDWNATYSTSLVSADAEVFIGSELYGDADSVETEDGAAEITFTAPGTYYLWAYGAEGASGSIVSAPAYAKVTVAPGEDPEDPEVPVITADLMIRSQMEGTYLSAIDEMTEVSSDLAEAYGYTDQTPGEVSALDALVAAHILIFGDDFTEETAGDYLAVSAAGYVTTIFGEATSSNGFLVNGGYPNDGTASPWGGYNGTTVATTAVADGDVVDFFTYGDTSYWSDYFTFTEVPETVEAGSNFEAAVSGTMVMMGYMYADAEAFADAAEALEDAALCWVDVSTGAAELIAYADEDGTLVLTDEDGVAEITAPSEPGIYYLSAASNEEDDVYAILNPVAVTVVEPPVPVVTEELMIRSQMAGTYLAPIDEMTEVSSGLAEAYGYTDQTPGEVSALDALVAAHILIFGDDFTEETAGDYLAVSAAGYVTTIFGEATSSNGFLVNGGYPNDGTESAWGGYNGTTVATTAVADGDVVDFFTYGDTSTWSDYYTFTEVPETVEAGSNFEAAVSGTMVMMGYMYADAEAFADAAEALEDAALCWVDASTGAAELIAYADEEGTSVLTDEDGVAEITAPSEPGIYYLSAASNEEDEVYVIMNPVAVEVTEATEPPAPAEVTATIKINTPSTRATLYAIEDEAKENDLFAEITPEGTSYTVTAEPGQYVLEAFTGEISNGTIVLTIDEDNTNIEVFTVTAYCTTSGFNYGTDYTIEKLNVLSGGDKATVVREVTMGDSSTAGRKTFLVLNGDTYSFYGTPTEARAETYTATYKTGTVTATNYTTASFTMATKAGLAVTVPYADEDGDGENDYILEVGQMTNYYIYTYLDALTDTVDAEAATETQTFETAKSGAYFYRVTNPQNADAVTYGNYITCSADSNTAVVTTEDMKVGNSAYTSSTVIKGFTENQYDTGDIYLNINEKGYLNLASGSSYNLYPFRNWLAIEGISNAKVIEPDFHIEIIDLDGTGAISVTEKTENNAAKHSYEMKANHAGTAIVLVTYDAMVDPAAMGTGKNFSAIWPENTGVFVVTVDGATGIDTGMTINEGLNTTKVSGDAYDADLDVLYYAGSEGASYTFTPEAGTNVTMSVGQLTANSMSFGAFTSDGVTVNADGTVTLSGLTEGKTIVKLTNGGRTEYQVLKARQLAYTITNAAGETVATQDGQVEGAVIKAGDTLTIKYDTVYIPANKLSGIYNMAGAIQLTGEDGTVFKGTANQYLFASTAAAQTVTVKIPKYWAELSYNLTGNVFESGFGSPYGSHRILTYEAGKSPNFTAVSCAGTFGALPTIELALEETAYVSGSIVLKDQDGNVIDPSAASISVKDNEGNVVTVNADGSFRTLEGTYDYVVNASGYMYTYGQFTVDKDASTEFVIVLTASTEGAWDGVSKTEPEKDEEGTYLISNGAELAWFQNTVTTVKNNTINAKLTADIDLASYPWTPIGSTSSQMKGIFDGNGHAINNLYCKGTGTLALFGCIYGTVKDLTVNGEVEGTSSSLAGVAAYAQGQNASNPCHIINVVNNVNITQNNVSASNASIGGIAGYTYFAVIENCTNNGTITTNSTSASASGYGGIVGYMMNYASSVTNCKNTGSVTGRKNVGGILGYAAGSKVIINTCYNTGDISGAAYVGGIVGDLQGAAFAHGYNTGSFTAAAEGAVFEPIANDSKSGNNVTDAWYLNSFTGTATNGTALSLADLKSRDIEGFGMTCDSTPALLWEDAQFHEKNEGVVTAPTCTEEGYTTYICPVCEKEYKGDPVPATGHTPVNQHVGYKDGACSVCGVEVTVWDDERLAALNYNEAVVSAISMTDTTEIGWIVSEADNGLTSGNKGVDSSTSATEISFTLSESAKVSFGYLVSSEARYDKLTISMIANGESAIVADAISGTADGTYEEILPAGSYTLSLSFYKDSSSASGRDLGVISDFTIDDTKLSIVEQPQNIESAEAGDTLTYSVKAVNAASYQWEFSKNGKKWYNTQLAGGQTDTVALTAAASNLTNYYRCKVTGYDGTVIYTEAVHVENVDSGNALAITQQPVNFDASESKAAEFSVTAANAASYQWYYSKDGGETWRKSNLEGAQTEKIEYSVATANMGNVFRCKVTGVDGTSVYTDLVYVTGVPAITAQPESAAYAAGQNAVFTVTVREPEICTYQWYYSKDGGQKWYKSAATGATEATLTVAMKESAKDMLYRCKVTANGYTATSDTVGFAQ